jgi:outer membrane protein assembly factor BamB
MNPRIATLAILTLALAGMPAAQAMDWSNQGGNAGRNGLTSEIGPGSADLAWSGGRSSLIAWHPVTEGNRVFMVRQLRWPYEQPNDAYIVAMDLTTGAELWAVVLPYVSGDWTPWIAGVRDGRVYCSRSGNGASVAALFYALDAADGHTLWVSDELQDAGPYDGVVFADDGDPLVASFQDIWRFDALDGHTVWHAARVGSVSGSCGGARYGDGLYVLDAVPGGHALKKFDVATGAFRYQSPTMPGFLCQVTPWVAPDGKILVNRAEASPANDFYYSWTDTGTALVKNWQVAGFGGAFAEHAVGADGAVYAVISGNRLARLHGATGALLNSIPLPSALSNAHMAIDGAGRLFFSNSGFATGHVYVYSADLQTLHWDVAVPNINIGGPAIGQWGTLVLCGVGTNVLAYRGDDLTAVAPAIALRPLGVSPNPCRESARIDFALPAAGPACLAVFDSNGRRVRSLLDGEAPAGSRSLRWDGRDEDGRALPSGVYFLRLAQGREVWQGRVVIAR